MRNNRGYFRFGIIVAAVLAVIASLLFLWGWRGKNGPEQPIAFNHRIHAGDYKINCLFCHDGARRSPVAGVPAVQRCIGCHSIIPSDRPEIQKLNSYWETKKPIEWVRIHRLPNFTRFNHKRHVSAEVSCQTCHGPVETMERVRQVSSLQMGWCIQCHRQRHAPTDCVTCHY